MVKNKRKKIFIPFFILIILFSCSKKTPEPIVARAGKTTIPVSEFRDRFELTPRIQQSPNTRRNKRNMLISMLGEKILVEEARNRHLNKEEKFLTFSGEMEKEAIFEKLFDEEIASKIEITTEEVKQGYVRSQVKLDLKVLTFENEQQAIAAKKEIDAGKSLTQVKCEFQTDTFISADSVITIKMEWGESHPRLENVAYSLKPNEVSKAIFVQGRYYILKLINRSSAVFLTEADFINKAPSIRKKIKQRKRTEMLGKFMNSIMVEKGLRVSHQIFDMVATELERIYGIEDKLSQHEKKSIELSPDSLKSCDFADHLGDTFVRFNDGSTWIVGEFIKKLSVGPYRLNKDSKIKFRKSLRRIIRKMAEFESLAKKGRDLGLDKSYYVRYQTKMWADSYLGELLRQQIIDTVSVSDAEVKYYHENHKNDYTGPDMVKLHEILVDNKKLAQKIFRRVKNGEDMRVLARQYNRREISIKTDGVMGYFKTSALGKIGEVAKKLKIGEITGPVKTEKDQYSVFKILDKREAGPLPLEQVRMDVKKDALTEKRNRTIDGFLINLADKYKVEINKSVIDTLKVNDINMLILKQHFANRTAAPIVTPLQKSYRWQNKMDEIYPYD